MLSILLPVRNGAATIEHSLASLQAQTGPANGLEMECLVVDDGSTDATSQILTSWQARWPALKVVRTSGVGIARALNLGLEHCRGKWIARMDADDHCHPERLSRQLVTARTEKLSLVGCMVAHDLRLIPEEKITAAPGAFEGMRRHIDWANGKLTHNELEQALWVDSPLPHPSWVVARSAFEKIGGYSETPNVPEDYEWLHRFFAVAREPGGENLRAGKTCGEALVYWADSSSRLTRTQPAYAEAAFNKVKARALETYLHQNPNAEREVFFFGLGPKAKALLPLISSAIPIRAIVEVHPRRIGIKYQGLEVWSVEAWRERVTSRSPRDSFVVISLGTAETRARGEALCLESGLTAGESFISL